MKPASSEGAAQESLSEPRVACVLVTWNNWKQTDRCLCALARQDYANLQVIVVDNGSTDGTIDSLRSSHPLVRCIENGSNFGFAKACNIGARGGIEGGAEFLWFLNNDTEPPPATARALVRKARGDPGVGIVGAVLFYLHDRARVQAWGGGTISPWSGFNRHFTSPHPMARDTYVTFASALVRREVFLKLEGLWEGLFLYFEDSDFSLRAVAAGWRLSVAEDTAILHAEGGTLAGQRRRSPLMDRIQTTSGIRFLERHGRVPVISVGLFLMLRLGKRVARRDWPALGGVMAGMDDWWKDRLTPFREDA